MLNFSKTDPLKVTLLAISPHNRAILEFFFSGAGRNLFKIVPAAEADAFILDNDHPEARDDWERHSQFGKPGIMLSVHPVDQANCVWIAKPLTSKALTDAVTQVHELLNNPIDHTAPPQPAVTEKPTAVDSPPTATQTFPPILEDEVEDNAALPDASVAQQPFGMASYSSSSSKLHAFMSAPVDDDEDEIDFSKPAKSETDDTQGAVEEKAAVFDPAEEEVSLEEVDRPADVGLSPEEAEQRWKLLCGDQEDVSNPENAVLFTPENYFLSSILDAIRLMRDSQQAVQLQLSEKDYALFMPEKSFAYCTLSLESDEFIALCNNPLQNGRVELHIPSSEELEQLEQQANRDSDALLDLESFIWLSSLLTAKGSLARNVDIHQQVILKHWPNMTRLEQFPQVMRIAALWNQRPATPFEMAQALGVPQRYVFSFHTAANALGLFEFDQAKLKSREKEKPKENRGFFSRLLKRLLGGGA